MGRASERALSEPIHIPAAPPKDRRRRVGGEAGAIMFLQVEQHNKAKEKKRSYHTYLSTADQPLYLTVLLTKLSRFVVQATMSHGIPTLPTLSQLQGEKEKKPQKANKLLRRKKKKTKKKKLAACDRHLSEVLGGGGGSSLAEKGGRVPGTMRRNSLLLVLTAAAKCMGNFHVFFLSFFSSLFNFHYFVACRRVFVSFLFFSTISIPFFSPVPCVLPLSPF
ncbi:hypothetical protein HOY82DRAFT_201817 [Tuber indicum]|nr:hypothetical protein HOY82DRAFT_201817 [Tuber indicum]